MGAHSLGQFHHFNIATLTRQRQDEATRVRWLKWLRDHQPDEPVKVITVTEQPRRWWSAIFQWIRRVLKGAE